MTNQKAVRLIRNLPTMCEFTDAYGDSIDSDAYYEAVDMAISALQTQPEIVRCKDCKFYSPMNRETKTGICTLTMHQNFGDDWFCAGAERRTDVAD